MDFVEAVDRVLHVLAELQAGSLDDQAFIAWETRTKLDPGEQDPLAESGVVHAYVELELLDLAWLDKMAPPSARLTPKGLAAAKQSVSSVCDLEQTWNWLSEDERRFTQTAAQI